MVSNFRRGVTLIEVIAVIAIIAVLLLIIVANFPAIKRQFALSRAAHKFAQDVRRAEDLALSGSGAIGNAQGYGIYVDLSDKKRYLIYADIKGESKPAGCFDKPQAYDGCDEIVEEIDLAKDSPGVSIKEINYTSSPMSINFTPPNPTVNITGFDPRNENRVWIVFNLDTDKNNIRTVYVFISGLIQVQ